MDPLSTAIRLLVDALRNAPTGVRRATLITTLALTITSGSGYVVSSFLPPNLKSDAVSKTSIIIFFTSAAVLLLAILSYTQLKLGESTLASELDPIRKEREQITHRLTADSSKDILVTIQLSLNQLAEYYTINKSQARNSFRFSVFAVVIGLITVVGGIWLLYFQAQSPSLQLATITSVAGILTQFIGAANFYLYDKSLKQLNYFYERLNRMQDIMLAIKLTEGITEDKRVDATRQLITSLLTHDYSAFSDQPPKVPRRKRTTADTATRL